MSTIQLLLRDACLQSEAEKERDMRATELLQQQTSASELEGRLAALTHSLTQEQEANKQLKVRDRQTDRLKLHGVRPLYSQVFWYACCVVVRMLLLRQEVTRRRH